MNKYAEFDNTEMPRKYQLDEEKEYTCDADGCWNCRYHISAGCMLGLERKEET